jgi:hypothetical protein
VYIVNTVYTNEMEIKEVRNVQVWLKEYTNR